MNQSSWQEDALFDALLKQTLTDRYAQELEETEALYQTLLQEPKQAVSIRARWKMRLLLRRATRRNHLLEESGGHRLRGTFLVAVLVAVLLMGLVVAQADRFHWFRMLFDPQPAYTDVYFDVEDVRGMAKVHGTVLEEFYLPTRVPEGFHLSDMQFMSNSFALTYTDGDREIVYSQRTLDPNSLLTIDTEDATVTSVAVQGFEGVCVQKNGNTLYVLNNQVYVCKVFGFQLSNKDLQVVVEHITNQKK